MSRFWMGGSSSEDESEEEERKSEEEKSEEEPQQNKPGTSKFMKTGSDDSDEESQKRVVKSARDRRFDELKETVQKIKNHIKINDWNAIQTGMYHRLILSFLH